MCDQGHEEIINRLVSLEDAFKGCNGELCSVKDDVIEIKNFLIGDMRATEPGLAERVRNLENWDRDWETY